MKCNKCPQYKSCTKPCEKINKILKDNGIHSADWIRPRMASTKRENGKVSREIGTDDLDKLATMRAFELKYGKRKPKVGMEDEGDED